MRFSLELELDKQFFPLDYRRTILSYTKKAIEECNKECFHKIYGDKGNINQKDYTFSVIFFNPKFNKDTISLDNNKIKIIFSVDSRNYIGFLLYNAFLEQKNKKFIIAKNAMTLRNLKILESKTITNNTIIMQTATGSSLCILKHDRESNKDTYYTPLDKEFKKCASIVIKNQAERAGFPKSLIDDLVLEPINYKKLVVSHYYNSIETTKGIFLLKGNPMLLQYFYDVGIGSRKSTGFGMIDIINQFSM